MINPKINLHSLVIQDLVIMKMMMIMNKLMMIIIIKYKAKVNIIFLKKNNSPK